MGKQYFQDYVPGNVCFGCGNLNHEGLQIKSYWEGEAAVCIWHSQEKYHGWANVLNGGIMATIIDCHCMNTAMAAAYRSEGRALGSQPEYRYATGTLTIKYLKPTSNEAPVELRTQVLEQKGRKTVMHCDIYSEGIKTAEAEVIAIRVYDGSQDTEGNTFIS